VGPYWGTKGENGEDDGVIDLSPVEEVEASDRVPKKVKSADGGAGAGCHDFGVGVPLEVVLDVNAKVSDRIGPVHREDPAAWETQCKVINLVTDIPCGCAGRLEAYVLRLIKIDAKAVAGEPLRHGTEGSSYVVCGNFVCGSHHENRAVIDICQEAMELP